MNYIPELKFEVKQLKMSKKIFKEKNNRNLKKEASSSKDQKKRPKNYLKRKKCEKCFSIKKNDNLVFCEICDDSYHKNN